MEKFLKNFQSESVGTLMKTSNLKMVNTYSILNSLHAGHESKIMTTGHSVKGIHVSRVLVEHMIQIFSLLNRQTDKIPTLCTCA